MAKTRPRRYFWALHFAPDDAELVGLSLDARHGLTHARELAKHARERSLSALEPGALAALAPLTVQELAKRNFLPPIQVKGRIKQARIELFGRDLSDSAIAYRLKQRRKRGKRACAEPDCEELIPALAHGRRRYCAAHASSAARARRHRYGAAGPARPPRPYRRRLHREEDPFAGFSPARREKMERFISALGAGEWSEPKRSLKRTKEAESGS
jgi:hypothetical protein